MASATKGLYASIMVRFAGSFSSSVALIQARQNPWNISNIESRFRPTSPALTVDNDGMRPGFLTMKAISSAGSPPTEKNSSPESFSTKVLNAG